MTVNLADPRRIGAFFNVFRAAASPTLWEADFEAGDVVVELAEEEPPVA